MQTIWKPFRLRIYFMYVCFSQAALKKNSRDCWVYFQKCNEITAFVPSFERQQLKSYTLATGEITFMCGLHQLADYTS